VDAAVLEARVRSAIGRVVSNPGVVTVSASGATITLSGPVLQDEVQELVRTARRVRGVAQVENRLTVHEHPGDVPDLQGVP
jgi:osmotically-inducible protein OsmY